MRNVFTLRCATVLIKNVDTARDDLPNEACIKFGGMLWNIPMVAALNEQSERVVRQNLGRGITLLAQLKRPVAPPKRKRGAYATRVIEEHNGIEWSWPFIQFILYWDNPNGYHNSKLLAKSAYYYQLKREGSQHSRKTFLGWVYNWLIEHTYTIDNAWRENKLAAKLLELQDKFQAFDQGKLRKAVHKVNIMPIEVDDNDRKWELRPIYTNYLHLLPSEHINEMVKFMLKDEEGGWAPTL